MTHRVGCSGSILALQNRRSENRMASDTLDMVWLTRLYVRFFIELGSRRVQVTGCTYTRPGPWCVMAQHALPVTSGGELDRGSDLAEPI